MKPKLFEVVVDETETCSCSCGANSHKRPRGNPLNHPVIAYTTRDAATPDFSGGDGETLIISTKPVARSRKEWNDSIAWNSAVVEKEWALKADCTTAEWGLEDQELTPKRWLLYLRGGTTNHYYCPARRRGCKIRLVRRKA